MDLILYLHTFNIIYKIMKLFCLETCIAQVIVEKLSINVLQKENDEVNLEQADSSNAVASSEDSKQLLLDTSNSDMTDSNEAEAKEIDVDEVQLKEAEVCAIPSQENPSVIAIDSDSTSSHDKTKEFDGESNVAQIDPKDTDSFKIKGNEIKETKSLDNLNIDAEVKENTSKINDDVDEQKDTKNVIGVKEITTGGIEDEDNIQDEELDHEIDEELDHEVDEEVNDFNQTTNNTVSLI